MGLALHNPPPDAIFAHKHFPLEPPRSARRYRGRDANLLRTVLERPVTSDDSPAKAGIARRRHSHSIPRRRASRPIPGVVDSDDEILRLARSSTPLPSDGSRNRRPSLERQDAFRDADTAKPPAARSLSQGCEDEDPEVAELYRLGLLYDDEHVRGAGFGFHAIARGEQAYTMTTRPARRRRAQQEVTTKIPLDWTFSGLEDDDEVARYLSRPEEEAPRRGYRTIWREAPRVEEKGEEGKEMQRSVHSDGTWDGDEDDEREWAVLSARGHETAIVEDATGAWVVLGDGS